MPLSLPQKLWEAERREPVDTAHRVLLPVVFSSGKCSHQWKVKPCKSAASKQAGRRQSRLQIKKASKKTIHGSSAPDCLTVLQQLHKLLPGGQDD